MQKAIIKNLPTVLLAGLGIMIVAGWNLGTIISALKGLFSSSGSVDNPLSESEATISDTEARILAETLYDAMEGMGTDEQNIYLAFSKMKNRGDYNKVYNAFGKRQYSRTWGNVGDPITSKNIDLIAWLSFELTGEEQTKLLKTNPQLNIFSK